MYTCIRVYLFRSYRFLQPDYMVHPSCMEPSQLETKAPSAQVNYYDAAKEAKVNSRNGSRKAPFAVDDESVFQRDGDARSATDKTVKV